MQTKDDNIDKYYMQLALNEAKKAYKKDEVPVGVVIVHNDVIISKAYNKSEHGKNALEHAEMIAINKACIKLGQNRLYDCTMYVTLEPCTMCACAISYMRIKKVVFGADNPKGGAIINGAKFFESTSCHHKPEIKYGILADETSLILKDFFKLKRLKDEK